MDDCERLHNARGWCRTHYMNWQRHGDPLWTRPKPPTPPPPTRDEVVAEVRAALAAFRAAGVER